MTTLRVRNKEYQGIDFPFLVISSHLFHLSLCNCPCYPPQPKLVHSATHFEVLKKADREKATFEHQSICADLPLIHKHRNEKWLFMSACLIWLKSWCLYILIYWLQCRIEMLNYFLNACSDFKHSSCLKSLQTCLPLLLFLCEQDRQMHIDTKTHKARYTVTHTHTHTHTHL